jgi:hypothetical protein
MSKATFSFSLPAVLAGLAAPTVGLAVAAPPAVSRSAARPA